MTELERLVERMAEMYREEGREEIRQAYQAGGAIPPAFGQVMKGAPLDWVVKTLCQARGERAVDRGACSVVIDPSTHVVAGVVMCRSGDHARRLFDQMTAELPPVFTPSCLSNEGGTLDWLKEQ